MYYTYKSMLNTFQSDYKINKEVEAGHFTKIKPGLYSDDKYKDIYSEVFLSMKQAVLTLQSAFHYYGLTDYIPEYVYVATPRNAHPYQIHGMKQVFISNRLYPIGIQEINTDKYPLRIYDMERTLIELIRYQSKLPFEEYQHVLRKFRERASELNIRKITRYAKEFRSYKKIIQTIQTTVL